MEIEDKDWVFILTEANQKILEISSTTSEKKFFVFTEFDESNFSAGIDYCRLRGIEITDFINLNKISLNQNQKIYLSQYNNFVSQRRELIYKFSNSMFSWISYTDY